MGKILRLRCAARSHDRRGLVRVRRRWTRMASVPRRAVEGASPYDETGTGALKQTPCARGRERSFGSLTLARMTDGAGG